MDHFLEWALRSPFGFGSVGFRVSENRRHSRTLRNRCGAVLSPRREWQAGYLGSGSSPRVVPAADLAIPVGDFSPLGLDSVSETGENS